MMVETAKKKRRSRKLPDILTKEEQAALLKAPNKKAPTGLRNLCMIRIMLNAGLRCNETLKLKPEHVNLNSGKLRVVEPKNARDRNLWLYDDDLDMLHRWMEIRPESKWLFCTLKGGQLSGRYVRYMVANFARRADIEKRVHPHLLRHTFASDLLRENKNIRLVQKALGHSSIAMTEIYTHVVDDELEDAMKEFGRGRANIA